MRAGRCRTIGRRRDTRRGSGAARPGNRACAWGSISRIPLRPRRTSMELASVRAVVTGGASGLGRATAARLAGARARVAILDRPASPGAEVAKSLGEAPVFTPADVTSADHLPAARALPEGGVAGMTTARGISEPPLRGTSPERVRASLAKQVPFPSRLGQPDEYAALACHIITNVMLNGETIRLDGAIRMAPR